jgi:cytochrome c oxidase subunit 4
MSETTQAGAAGAGGHSAAAIHENGRGHGHAAHDDKHDDGKVHAHISSTRFYVGVFAALIFLTIVTVKVSYYDFGSANTIIAILIATMKASLVAAFFMHLRHDKLFNTLAFLAAFLFLSIFLLLTNDDLGKRARVDPTYGGKVEPETGQVAPGGMPSSAPAEKHEGKQEGEHH